MRALETDSNDPVLIGGLLVLIFLVFTLLNQLNSAKPRRMLGSMFSLLFSFSHSLVIVYSFSFRSRYFVNYAPLLRAVCKFHYSLLSRPFFLPVYASISVTAFVEVDSIFFLGFPDH